MRVLIFMWVIGVLCGTCSAQSSQSWELRNGQWEQVHRPTTQPLTDLVLDHIEEMLKAGQNSAARKLAVRWLLKNPQSPIRDRGLYLEAEALFQDGSRIRSFYYLDELMDEYPQSPLFYQALQKQYEIADAFLNGYKRKFLGIPLFGAEGEAIEMLFRIQARAPGSPLAEKALRRTADYYFANSDFDLAADAYTVYIHSYPRSPDIPRVKLRQAYSSLAQFQGTKFDATPLLDARAQLVQIRADYPKLAAEENVDAVIGRIDDTFARKIYEHADFYRRTGQSRAAVYVYRYLIETYPKSKAALDAQKRLQKMPAKARSAPPPPPGTGYAPNLTPEGP